MRTGWILLLALTPGCDALFPPTGPESDADTDVDTDTDTDTDTDADTDTDTVPDVNVETPVPATPPAQGSWVEYTHPCIGSRTDAMLIEDAGRRIWIGCGTNSEGFGLFRSRDGGQDWEEVNPNVLDSWRINDIHRGADGELYIAGVDSLGDGRGARLDNQDQVEELLLNSGQLWNAMVTGSVRTTAAGEVVFESLNGTDVAYRSGEDSAFTDANPWSINGDTKQILDLEELDGDFYGVGATISDFPQVFLPPPENRSGFQMYNVILSESFDGELFDLLIDDEGMAVAGVNQTEAHGVVFINLGNPYAPQAWRLFEADLVYPSRTTWFDSVCRSNGRLIAVGRFSSTSVASGMAVGSDDDGLSWYPIALPADTGALQICQGMPDGSFRFAGANGFFASYTF